MRRRILGLAALAAIVIAVVLGAGPTAGCGGKDAAAPQQDVCGAVSFSSSGSVSFSMPCSQISSNVSNITYDQFSRRISYDFSVSCATGGTSYVGSVRNIRWDNLGRALGADVNVNGKVCHF